MTQTSPEHDADDQAVTQSGGAGLSGMKTQGVSGDEPGRLRLTGQAQGPGLPWREDFNAVVAEHESALLRYARHQLGRDYEGRHHDAQDIVQEALLRLHRHWREKGLDGLQSARAWLMRVTHNLTIDAIRKRTRQRAAKVKMQQDAVSSTDHANPEPDSLGALETREATQRAMCLLHELPDTQQRVMMLRLDDLTVRQIAEVLNMSPGNVGYHLNQGLTTLARQLKQSGVV